MIDMLWMRGLFRRRAGRIATSAIGLAGIGVKGVLVASALHDGLLTPDEGSGQVLGYDIRTESLKIPNPCNVCHADKSTGWAMDALKRWPNASPWRIAE